MFRGRRGERGQRGDPGHIGPPGLGTPDDLERLVIKTTAEALAANRLRLTDKRLLIMFLLVVASTAGVFFTLDRQFETFRRAVVISCEADNETNRGVNAQLDLLARNAMSNPARTPAERARIAEDYRKLRLPITDCPP